MAVPVAAQVTYEVLQEFERPGSQPLAPLLHHSDGNFYGVAVAAGAFGHGTVFRLSPDGDLTTLLSFTGTTGSAPGHAPIGALAEGDNGDLYGTTSGGGANGFGVAFRLTTAGTYTLLADFSGSSEPAGGSVPGSLVTHPDGDFYGTTQAGGAGGFGTVFRMTAEGTITTLLEFTGIGGARPGSRPVGPLAVDGDRLYGVTREGGGNGEGTAFELTTGGAWRLLLAFDSVVNGALPSALIIHSNGKLYGTAEFGGDYDFGTAFSISTGASPSIDVLHSFDDPEGSQPAGRLVEGANGDLFGVASLGGTDGWGVVFELSPSGSYTVLRDFTGSTGPAPGAEPLRGLTSGPGSALFGVTSAGGPANLGTIFRIETNGVFQPLASFSRPTGWFPSGAPTGAMAETNLAEGILFPVAAGGDEGGGALLHLVPGSKAVTATPLGGLLGDGPSGGLLRVGNAFYGVTTTGGAQGRGTAFRYEPGLGASLVTTYNNTDGSHPDGPLIVGGDGALYGAAREGGSSFQGTVYRLTTGGVRTRLTSLTGLFGSAPGRRPRGPLALAGGEFYGLAELGGADNAGTIFKISPAGSYTPVHEFLAGGPRAPRGGLVAGTDGFLYGSTSQGGTAEAGALIRVNPSNDNWSTVGELTGETGAARGRTPAGTLAVGPDGTIYGMTTAGGDGYGGIFHYPPGGTLEDLLLFTGTGGAFPGQGEAILGQARIGGGLRISQGGVLYGVAPAGGSGGGGVAFRVFLTPFAAWKQSHLGDPSFPDFADPDRDGVPILFEYAFGLVPTLGDAGELPGTTASGVPGDRRLTVSLQRNPGHADINIQIEVCSGLNGPWETIATSLAGQPFAGPGEIIGDGPGPGIRTVEIRDYLSIGTEPRRFVRIGVSRE